MAKVCTKCKKDKPLGDYYKNRSQKSNLNPSCKDCQNKANKKSLSLGDAKQRKNEYDRAYMKSYNRENRATRTSQENFRRARKLEATPPWLTGSQKAHINRTYKLAQMMQEVTGDTYHVDHIVPLQGKNVCGLHVPWNLQALRADLNLKKGNRHF